ncbi:MAG: hypothetical protein U5P41_00045 [Gammaproteobacteria bacterium]|nr:hypothetical protein [Gammaproteobacteria bacterium]
METALPLLREGREVDFLFLPPEDDPDTFIRRDGTAAFTNPARLTPLSDYLIQYLRGEIDTSTREGKARLADRAMGYARQLASDSLRDLLVRKISDITFMNEHELKRQLGDTAIPVAHTPRTAASTRHAPSLVGHTIALLLQRPALALEITEPRTLAGVDMPGVEFLVELVEFIHANPRIKTAGILEHWRDSRYATRLGELAGTDFDDQVNLEAEFRDCLTRLQKLQRGRRLQELRQIPWPQLSEDQKEELRALTSAVSQPE